MSDTERLKADRDRAVLAQLVDTLTSISFDGCDYGGAEIQADLVKFGILQLVDFDPARHVDHNGAAEPGDPFFEFTPYGRKLILLASTLRAEKKT